VEFFANTNYIKNISKEEIDNYYALFEKRANQNNGIAHIKYLRLGNVTVKIENYVPELVQPIETQLAYCISDKADSQDYTFFIWKDDVKSFVADFAKEATHLLFYPKNAEKPAIEISLPDNSLKAYNTETKSHYISSNNFPDDFVPKMGHLFVRELYSLAKTDNQSLVHAAAVGIDDNGVLLCARGGSGKSTLAVSALLDGFQYVADDYSILSRTAEGVYAYPIYSTINLFPQMQAKMQHLQAEIMYPNYYQPLKNTLSIHAHHANFVKRLPIKAVIFPKIATVKFPSIEPMDKGKAIVQMIHSTMLQLDKTNNTDNVKKLISFISDLDFYQINLSPDLDANVKLLKQFIKGTIYV
jgi:hypothetical protein